MVKKVSSRKAAGKGKDTRPAAAKTYGKGVGKAAVGVEPAPKRLKKTPLSKSELEQFRQMLLAKRRDLIGDMSGIESGALRTNRQEGSGDLSNMPTHPADIGSDNFEHEFTLGLLESERTLLKEIDQALDRVERGVFGICLGTGQFIGTARLRARPWAKYCIEYAKMLEKGLVQPVEKPATGEEEEGEELEEEPEEPAADVETEGAADEDVVGTQEEPEVGRESEE